MTMTAGTATYGVLTEEQRLFYEMTLLRRAVGPFLHLWFGQQGSVFPVTTLPENQGHQIQWRKFGALTSVTTPLTEGTTPEPHDITITSTTGTVYEYGAYVRYTRYIAQLGIDKIAAEASDALGEQAGDSLDLITRATLVAETANVQYANGRASSATIVSGDYYTATEALKALATLKNNKAVPIVDGKYPTLVHPYTEYDMFQDPVIQAILHYTEERGKSNPWISGFIGEAFGQRYYSTPNGYSLTNGTIDIYSTLTLGKNSFGVGGLAAYMPSVMPETQDGNHTFQKVRPLRLIDKDFGSAGTSDPLNQRASIGWYTTFLTKVLDTNFYVRVEHDVTLG